MNFFCQATLTVRDLDASVRFYNEVVGLPIDRRGPAGPDGELAFLGDGETKVELICYEGRPEAIVGNGACLGFRVESVPETLERLRGGGIPVVSDIIQPNPHVRFFYALDPDGFRVQFVEDL